MTSLKRFATLILLWVVVLSLASSATAAGLCVIVCELGACQESQVPTDSCCNEPVKAKQKGGCCFDQDQSEIKASFASVLDISSHCIGLLPEPLVQASYFVIVPQVKMCLPKTVRPPPNNFAFPHTLRAPPVVV